MAEHNYHFEIKMTCGGCSGAVDRVLKKLDGKLPTKERPTEEALPFLPLSTPSNLPHTNKASPGVKSYEVSLEDQTADVVTEGDALSYAAVLEKIKKTGKEVKSAQADGVAQAV